VSFVFDLKGFSVIATAFADIASRINISQKIHLDTHETFAPTGFASASADVK
jgi:hypothetical protein